MISTNDLKNGITIEYEGNIYVVMDTQHVKPGKGAAIVKAKLKNLRTGAIIEQTFNAGVKVATARIEKQLMQYLYNMNDVYYFMNMESYEQLEIPASKIADQAKLLKENLEVYITSYEGEILGVALPDKVELVVTHTEPAVKGNTTVMPAVGRKRLLVTALLQRFAPFVHGLRRAHIAQRQAGVDGKLFRAASGQETVGFTAAQKPRCAYGIAQVFRCHHAAEAQG